MKVYANQTIASATPTTQPIVFRLNNAALPSAGEDELPLPDELAVVVVPPVEELDEDRPADRSRDW